MTPNPEITEADPSTDTGDAEGAKATEENPTPTPTVDATPDPLVRGVVEACNALCKAVGRPLISEKDPALRGF